MEDLMVPKPIRNPSPYIDASATCPFFEAPRNCNFGKFYWIEAWLHLPWVQALRRRDSSIAEYAMQCDPLSLDDRPVGPPGRSGEQQLKQSVGFSGNPGGK